MDVGPKRERWTEADVRALPPGEPDYFDRKSGKVVDDVTKLKGTLAKALSAFANSGGGHLLLGVADDGALDGAPPRQGQTPTREWLEQIIPNLTSYPLSDFRVHEVEPELQRSGIPGGRIVLVIDVGDSPLAPHQCAFDGGGARKGVYYQRQGGHSVPAGHFYLELLRQRLTNPALEVTFEPAQRWFSEQPVTGGLFIALELPYRIENVGRIAAYKWGVQGRLACNWQGPGKLFGDRTGWPVPARSRDVGIPIDPTLLPGSSTTDRWTIGVHLRGDADEQLRQLKGITAETVVNYRVATESALTDYSEIPLASLLEPEGLLRP